LPKWWEYVTYLHQKPNAWVAVDIDVDKYWDEIENGLRRYSK